MFRNITVFNNPPRLLFLNSHTTPAPVANRLIAFWSGSGLHNKIIGHELGSSHVSIRPGRVESINSGMCTALI